MDKTLSLSWFCMSTGQFSISVNNDTKRNLFSLAGLQWQLMRTLLSFVGWQSKILSSAQPLNCWVGLLGCLVGLDGQFRQPTVYIARLQRRVGGRYERNIGTFITNFSWGTGHLKSSLNLFSVHRISHGPLSVKRRIASR